jgi:signal transduction histidine kinase
LMDSDQMTQVFLNVLLNALEGTASGGEVKVEYDNTSEQGRLRITLSDTGEGIPRENLDKLFDPFFSTKKKGTGLGLAIVKSIIEGHGGEIEVESELGKGTKIAVILSSYQSPDGRLAEEDTIDLGKPVLDGVRS